MKNILLTVCLLFIFIQLTLTIKNKHLWPFCAYNMFNRIPSQVMIRPKLKLYFDNDTTRIINIHETLPLEFFKAIGIYYTVFLDLNIDKKKEFSQLIINTLNNEQWDTFDEVHQLYNPPSGVKVVAFDLIEYQLNFKDFLKTKKVSMQRGDQLFTTRSL